MPKETAAPVRPNSTMREPENATHRDNGTNAEGDERGNRRHPRATSLAFRHAEFFAGERFECRGVVSEDAFGHRPRFDLGKALGPVYKEELFFLFLRHQFQLLALDGDLPFEGLGGAADANPLAQGHAYRAGDQSAQAGQQHDIAARVRAGNADHE
jgi:hypothetical protein